MITRQKIYFHWLTNKRMNDCIIRRIFSFLTFLKQIAINKYILLRFLSSHMSFTYSSAVLFFYGTHLNTAYSATPSFVIHLLEPTTTLPVYSSIGPISPQVTTNNTLSLSSCYPQPTLTDTNLRFILQIFEITETKIKKRETKKERNHYKKNKNNEYF